MAGRMADNLVESTVAYLADYWDETMAELWVDSLDALMAEWMAASKVVRLVGLSDDWMAAY